VIVVHPAMPSISRIRNFEKADGFIVKNGHSHFDNPYANTREIKEAKK